MPPGCGESVLAEVPDEVAAAALASWAALFGLVSFELFGQFENVITDRAAFFAHAVGILGRMAGAPPEPVSPTGSAFPRIATPRVAPVRVSNLYSIY